MLVAMEGMALPQTMIIRGCHYKAGCGVRDSFGALGSL